MSLVALSLVLALGGTTYYVDGGGIPPGSGTQQDPFTTISGALGVSFANGDTIVVAPGLYRENVVLPNLAPISIFMRSADGAETTIIESVLPDTPVVTMGDLWFLEGFTLRGATGPNGAGIHVPTNRYAVVERCIMTGNEIGFWTAGDGGFGESTIAGNELGVLLDDSALQGVLSGANDSIIWGNTVGGIELGVPFLAATRVILQAGINITPIGPILKTDPLFWDAANGDYHLRSGSPAIGFGLDSTTNLPIEAGAFPYDPSYAPTPQIYCTAKTSSAGCLAMIGMQGANASFSSPLPALVSAQNVPELKAGLLVVGSTAAAIPFLGGVFCMAPPVQRTGLQPSGTSGGVCSGTFQTDVNALIQGGALSWLSPGQTLYGQYWFRDPGDPFLSALSNAIALGVTE